MNSEMGMVSKGIDQTVAKVWNMKLPTPIASTSTTRHHSNSARSARAVRASCTAAMSPAMMKAPLEMALSGSAQNAGSPPRSQ